MTGSHLTPGHYDIQEVIQRRDRAHNELSKPCGWARLLFCVIIEPTATAAEVGEPSDKTASQVPGAFRLQECGGDNHRRQNVSDVVLTGSNATHRDDSHVAPA